ncbi:hypothetical protein [Sphaerochaeta sp. PS]|uniref:hypothetical protein n=1 Tax=Sphaerochaeta sp. PS TaxID=3076336 RepID=UPI0028A33FF9|nr:hypothetical protein [Sphaerochaeta sp. PS]MDT4761142.1 hypothetical protein [Sphaerochaeta sp. PS]
MPLSKWKKILEGMEFVKGGWSWYDGERYHVSWSFNKSNSPKGKGTFTISSNDGSGRECIRDAPLSEIRVFHYE